MIEPAITAGAFLSQLVANFAGETPADAAAGGAVAEDFSQILASQENLSEVLGRLRELLPEAAFARVEALLTEGKGLPLAADVAGQALSDSALTQEDMASLYAAFGLVYPLGQEQVPGIADKLRSAALPGTPAGHVGVPARAAAQAGAVSNNAPVSGAAQQTPLTQALAPGLEAPAIVAGEAAAVTLAAGLPQIMKPGLPSNESASSALAHVGVLSGALAQTSAESAALSRPALSAPADMDVPLGDAKWDRSLGDRMLWMIGRAQQSASIKITPPDMGAIEIKVSVKNDQVNVGFTAQHAAVKEALEAAVPRLREMFGENNLQLVNVDVGQRGDSGQRPMADGFAGQSADGQQDGFSAAAAEDGAESAEVEGLHYYRSDSLLDDYA